MASTLTVGTLAYGYQAIDAFGLLDVLSSGSDIFVNDLELFHAVNPIAKGKAPKVVFHHVGLNREPIQALTTGLTLVPTCTVDDAPDFDILLVPGPNPYGFELDPRFKELIHRQVASGRLLFTNCTGACIAAQAGVLDGKKATVNHAFLKWAAKEYPNVNWTAEAQWVVDGNVWTAAGAVAGMDMAAHWLKENYGKEVMTLSAMNLDFEPRDVKGVLNVIPQRYDAEGKQTASHVFDYTDSF
uniref:DJ-1/PfpI domain-containing protein n=1 Tax=Bionectria ochroleuca TaxID=29856 RepID=A0A8H7NGX8_BIOOC